MSVGSTFVVPPSEFALATAASTSGTATYASQCGGAPAWDGSSVTPPAGVPPTVHIVYGIGDSHLVVPQPAIFV
jgi:hypothetical protein